MAAAAAARGGRRLGALLRAAAGTGDGIGAGAGPRGAAGERGPAGSSPRGREGSTGVPLVPAVPGGFLGSRGEGGARFVAGAARSPPPAGPARDGNGWEMGPGLCLARDGPLVRGGEAKRGTDRKTPLK